jgi:prepilin-type N-terminal cleavage/methylation domain-containing protein
MFGPMDRTAMAAKTPLVTGEKSSKEHMTKKNSSHSLLRSFNCISSGFSLLELMVVIVLIGGMIALIIPAIRAVVGLDLRGEITKIAGLSNEVYALAAVSGKTHRIVFDLDTNKYWVEEKVGDAGEIKPELGYEDLMKSRIENKGSPKEDDAAKAYLPSFKEVEGPLKEKFDLPKDAVIYGAWTEAMTDVARTGQVAIYFFTGGYSQASFVSLAVKGEEEDTAIYFSLNPLTAEVTIKLGEPDTKDLVAAESET